MATFSASALKAAAVCMVLLCFGSDLARPALASSSFPDDQEAAEASALLRELLARTSSPRSMGLLDAGLHGDVVATVCTPACQNCLIVCAITCVLNANPATCFANCTVTTGCFSKAALLVA